MKRKCLSILLVLVLSLSCLFAAGAGEAKRSDVIELEFMQWFAPELPSGAFEALIAEFEAQNPNIKVKITSIPNANYKDQVIAGIATGTLADVVALDEKYIVDIKDGLVPLDKYLNATSFKDDISVITKVGNDSKSVALVVFMYPLFVNMDLLKANGFNAPPQNRTEFAMMAKALTNSSKNQYGWVLPFPIISSTGLRIELMSLYWTNGNSMVKNGKPNLAGNQDLIKTIEYVKNLYDTAVSPVLSTKPSRISWKSSLPDESPLCSTLSLPSTSLMKEHRILIIRSSAFRQRITTTDLVSSETRTGRSAYPLLPSIPMKHGN